MASPVLHTERLVLRLAAMRDVPAILRYLQNNRERFAATEPRHAEAYYTAWHQIRQVRRNAADLRQDRALRLLVLSRDEGELVGTIAFSNIMRGAFQACYLGFALGGAYEGRGFMSEALQQAIGYAFDHLRLHRIMASHLPDNLRSARLLARLGFVVEGQAENYLFIDGAWRTHVLTALTNPRW
ncbi:MAG: GNAT family N-acetyltransferase [Candidatus Xenobia bacterium]